MRGGCKQILNGAFQYDYYYDYHSGEEKQEDSYPNTKLGYFSLIQVASMPP